ncbi:MAG: biotin/lipoyl-binding protein [Prolixibacteraceae bacterium]|nr:biotin/lipoyl-binding protein [Prolixibacteraceae bacterium]
MPVELKIDGRTAKVEILEKKDTFYRVRIGAREYEVDITKVAKGIYSLLYRNHSINMEMIEGDTSNKYIVNTLSNEYTVEVIDARSRYLAASKSEIEGEDTIITSPMPGKVVKIPVSEGAEVEKGDTVIIVAAMKMESEYKSPVCGKVVRIFVNENDTITGNQPLVEIEPVSEKAEGKGC